MNRNKKLSDKVKQFVMNELVELILMTLAAFSEAVTAVTTVRSRHRLLPDWLPEVRPLSERSLFVRHGVWVYVNGNTYLLTSLSRVLLENLAGSQQVKKFLAFYGTRRFITAFTSARYLSLS